MTTRPAHEALIEALRILRVSARDLPKHSDAAAEAYRELAKEIIAQREANRVGLEKLQAIHREFRAKGKPEPEPEGPPPA